jgi:hypothetical protein
VAVPEIVNVDNSQERRATACWPQCCETTGGIGQWMYNREPTRLDYQTVIRQDRDTLYSAAVIDVSEGVTLTAPDTGDRYVSAMLVNQDHLVTAVFHEAAEHLTGEQLGAPYVLLGVRTLTDPADPDDVAAAHALQDAFEVAAPSEMPFELPNYDEASFTATRQALLELARGLGSFEHALRHTRRR